MSRTHVQNLIGACVLAAMGGPATAQEGRVFWCGHDNAGNVPPEVHFGEMHGGVIGSTTTYVSTAGNGVATAIDYDPLNFRVYWIETYYNGTYSILSSDFDGNGIVTHLTRNGSGSGLAVDTRTGEVYWSEIGVVVNGALYRNLGAPRLVASGNVVWGVEVDCHQRSVYWGNLTQVWRAALSGASPAVVASNAAYNIYGVSVDPATQDVYFTSIPPSSGAYKVTGGVPATVPVVTGTEPYGIDARQTTDASVLLWVEKTGPSPSSVPGSWIGGYDPAGFEWTAAEGLTSGQIDVAFWECPLDQNFDGQVNILDYVIFVQDFRAHWGTSYTRLDFNCDGTINNADYLYVLSLFNQGC